MIDRQVVALKAFVPAKDFELSTRFYEDLGFSVIWSNEEVKELGIGASAFILQNYYQEDWANNFMLQLVVEDLDAWWRIILEKDVASRYAGVQLKEPQNYPWGLREIHLIDPSGVLWHIAQKQAQ